MKKVSKNIFLSLLASVFLIVTSCQSDASNQLGKIKIINNDKVSYVDSVDELNDFILRMKNKNNIQIIFKKDTYVVNEEIKFRNANEVFIDGNNSTMHFPKGKIPEIYLIDELKEGDVRFQTNKNSFFEINRRYQIYAPDKSGDRLLELSILKIEDGYVYIKSPVRFMQHVKKIPAKSWIYNEYNFITISNSSDITIKNMNFDGLELGDVRAHTIYSGILIHNNFYDARKNGGGKYGNINIKDNFFRNLKGRAVAAYATNGIYIRNCKADNIAVEVFEIDHFSTGVIEKNVISNSHIAIQLNDAYHSRVNNNKLINVNHGVIFKAHFNDQWVNFANTISGNDIAFRKTGLLTDGKSKNNLIINNAFHNKVKSFVGDFNGSIISKNTFK